MKKPLTLITIGCLCWLWVCQCQASDIAQKVRQPGSSGPVDGGYLELGLSAQLGFGASFKVDESTNNAGIDLAINAGYQKSRFFIDLYPESVTPLVLGLNLFHSGHSALDIVSGPQNGEITAESIDNQADIKTRHMDYLAGLRFTHYHRSTIFQLEARKDISKTHDGEFYLFLTGHSWSLGNGTQHLLAGLAYQTADVIDYYLGIDEQESNEAFPSYQPHSAFIYKLEYGITYPLSAKWIMRSQAVLFRFDNEIAQSPIMVDGKNERIELSSSISYVF